MGRNQATTIAKKLDKLLQVANGNAQRVISRKTIASLLRLIISGKTLSEQFFRVDKWSVCRG